MTPALTFPATASWDTWASVRATYDVPPSGTLSIRFDAASGSASYLNLDRIVLTPAP